MQSLNRYILGRVKGQGACRSHVEAIYPAFRVTDCQRSITASVLTFMSTIFLKEIVTKENNEDYPNIPAITFLSHTCIQGTVIFASTRYCYFMWIRNTFVPMETIYRVLKTPKFRLPCPVKCGYASVNSIHWNL